MSRLEAVREAVDTILHRVASEEERRCSFVHLYGVSAIAALLASLRGQNEELAATAGILHDLATYESGDSTDHAARSARRAVEILRGVGGYDEQEIGQIASAIEHHSEKSAEHGPFEELLKDADVLQHDLYHARALVRSASMTRRGMLCRDLEGLLPADVERGARHAADWVQEFYSRQAEWTGIYEGELDAFHYERAMWVDAVLGGRTGCVLELGCGGGQTAAALADRGHHVVAVDLNPRLIEHARSLAAAREDGRMTALAGDFYKIELNETFDAVCYFDGFGVGSDADQRWLLARIAQWLRPEGAALVDVYTPWYWANAHDQEMEWKDACRRHAFDGDECRMLDTWWPRGKPDEAVTQSLRCYSPADLRLLLRGTGLVLADVLPGGAVDLETGEYCNQVPLDQAMSYLATLRPDSNSG